jgi:hypothetical protein
MTVRRFSSSMKFYKGVLPLDIPFSLHMGARSALSSTGRVWRIRRRRVWRVYKLVHASSRCLSLAAALVDIAILSEHRMLLGAVGRVAHLDAPFFCCRLFAFDACRALLRIVLTSVLRNSFVGIFCPLYS